MTLTTTITAPAAGIDGAAVAIRTAAHTRVTTAASNRTASDNFNSIAPSAVIGATAIPATDTTGPAADDVTAAALGAPPTETSIILHDVGDLQYSEVTWVAKKKDLGRILKTLTSKKAKAESITRLERHYERELASMVAANKSSLCPVAIRKRRRVLIRESRRPGLTAEEAQKIAADLEGLEWTLSCLEMQQETELFLQCPEALLALWIGDAGVVGAVQLRGNRVSVCTLEDDYVKERLLTVVAYRDDRYKKGTFTKVQKYDRRDAMESTTFSKLRMVDPGLFSLMDNTGATVRADYSWVVDPLNAVPPTTVRAAVSAFEKGPPYKYIPFDDGARPKSAVSVAQGSSDSSMPKLMYLNGSLEHSCVPAGIASALHMMGYCKLAATFHSLVSQRLRGGFGCASVRTVTDEVLLHLGVRQRNIRPKRRRRVTLDHCRAALKVQGYPVVASLMGSTAGINHCVVFVGDLMVDANSSRATQISHQALDEACCGSGFAGMKGATELLLKKCKLG